MRRMRGISAVVYRPNKAVRYRNIDALSGDAIDWELLANLARDMIQVALSMQAGRVMPTMLLRRLQPEKLALSRFPRSRSGGAHTVSPTLDLPCQSLQRHPRRDLQDRGLQRPPRLGLLRLPRGQERRFGGAGKADEIREAVRKYRHAFKRRRPHRSDRRQG